jgi:hypothetical protein
MLELAPEEGSRPSAESRMPCHRHAAGMAGLSPRCAAGPDSNAKRAGMKSDGMKMELTLAQIPRDDPHALTDIHRLCLHAGFNTPVDRLKSSWFGSSPATVCYGAYARGKLVAANLFPAHDVLVSNVRRQAFQCGWGATDPEFREQGLFAQIIERAKADLASRGASFIFGFADAVSASQFTNGMGFRAVGMRRPLFMTAGPGLLLGRQLDVREYFHQILAENVVRFDQYQNFRWKSHERADLISSEHYTNFIWGRNTRYAIPGFGQSNIFQAGGCEINKPQLFGDLLRKLRLEHGVMLVRFACTADSMVALASRISLAGSQAGAFLYFPLTALPAEVQFDAHAGLGSAY